VDTLPILVWWDDSESLIGKLEKDGPERRLMRKLQRYSVSLPCCDVMRLLENREVREIRPGIFAQDVDTLYDRQLGVVMENSTPIVF
jgi:CRISPR-associated endonuclease/helicase Cas3